MLPAARGLLHRPSSAEPGREGGGRSRARRPPNLSHLPPGEHAAPRLRSPHHTLLTRRALASPASQPRLFQCNRKRGRPSLSAHGALHPEAAALEGRKQRFPHPTQACAAGKLTPPLTQLARAGGGGTFYSDFPDCFRTRLNELWASLSGELGLHFCCFSPPLFPFPFAAQLRRSSSQPLRTGINSAGTAVVSL